MRKTLWITLAALFVAIGAPNVRADSYTYRTIDFTVTGGNVPAAPTGSFIYDNTTNIFTSFEVVWNNSIGFLLADCANGSGQPAINLTCEGFSDSQTSFLALMWCDDATTSTCSWFAGTGPPDFFSGDALLFMANGPWEISEFHLSICCAGEGANGTFTVSTPEPGTFGLMLLGIGLVLLMRKRMGQGASTQFELNQHGNSRLVGLPDKFVPGPTSSVTALIRT